MQIEQFRAFCVPLDYTDIFLFPQYVYSKGTVLDKTVEYLKELMAQNEQLATTAKIAEKSASALAVLQNQIGVLEKENAFLRAQIIQFGIDAAASSGSQTSGEFNNYDSYIVLMI